MPRTRQSFHAGGRGFLRDPLDKLMINARAEKEKGYHFRGTRAYAYGRLSALRHLFLRTSVYNIEMRKFLLTATEGLLIVGLTTLALAQAPRKSPHESTS